MLYYCYASDYVMHLLHIILMLLVAKKAGDASRYMVTKKVSEASSINGN